MAAITQNRTMISIIRRKPNVGRLGGRRVPLVDCSVSILVTIILTVCPASITAHARFSEAARGVDLAVDAPAASRQRLNEVDDFVQFE